MDTLSVRFVALSECLVSPGRQLELRPVDSPGLHYNLLGTGWAFVGDEPPIDLQPHTLIIVPSNCAVRIEASSERGAAPAKTVEADAATQTPSIDGVPRYVAGDSEPEITLICGYFKASYGAQVDLFGALASPIIEQFCERDELDSKLKSALAELVAQEVGSGAMSAALLKQVIVALLRRSLNSTSLWVERFSMLSDPQIARAFSDMVANPGGPHTVVSLAKSACLSRSAFMARFTEVVGSPPMNVLRDLRMRQAANQLRANDYSINQIVHNAGYESRSSFVRAFRKAYDRDPSEFRAEARLEDARKPVEAA
jgi:AraC-like DNA-binding protein